MEDKKNWVKPNAILIDDYPSFNKAVQSSIKQSDFQTAIAIGKAYYDKFPALAHLAVAETFFARAVTDPKDPNIKDFRQCLLHITIASLLAKNCVDLILAHRRDFNDKIGGRYLRKMKQYGVEVNKQAAKNIKSEAEEWVKTHSIATDTNTVLSF